MAYIVVGTANNHKFDEYLRLLDGQDVELKSLKDYPDFKEVDENGTTFAENAAIKAIAVSQYCQEASFADDSGLEVEALNNEPGIYSARYEATDELRMAKVLDKLKDNPNRNARFVCVIAIALNGEVIETFEGEVKGKIIDAPRGENGFGYDPIFVPDGYEQTFAEMPQELKNKISHRANAVSKALEFIEEQMAVLANCFD